ncbi:MAG: acyltransferase family protein, partial [Deltaproteobacteria bacterium]|nr:acyltransferase family protein [Deltaproteobacteria bacterium]
MDKLLKLVYDEEIIRKFDRLPRHNLNEFGFDPYGYNPEFIKKIIPAVLFFYRVYFRTVVEGIEKVPRGRVIIVANHSGQIPIDGSMIVASMIVEAEPPRMVRSMVERWVPTLPFVSYFMSRTGQVMGTVDNCLRLLNNDEAILVFPEGVKGISKTFFDRYKLQEFGNGFMRLALASKSPIVPVAVIGAEEQAPALHNSRTLAKLVP